MSALEPTSSNRMTRRHIPTIIECLFALAQTCPGSRIVTRGFRSRRPLGQIAAIEGGLLLPTSNTLAGIGKPSAPSTNQRTRLPFLSLALMLLSSTSPTRVQAESGISDLRAGFESEVKQLDAPLLSLDSRYREHMEKQKHAYQQAGNLKGMLAIDEALKDFANPSHPDSEFIEVKRLQEVYRVQKTGLQTKRQTAYLILLGKYRSKAEEMAKASTKAGRIDEAKAALAESERFAALEKSAGSPLPPTTAVAPSSGHNLTSFSALLEEAKASIRRINDPVIQSRLWRDVARAQAVCGNFDEATLTAKRIDDSENKSLALADIADILAEGGRTDEALAVINAIPDRFRADFCLAMLASQQLRRNDFSGAARTAELIRGQAGKSIHYVAVAEALLAKGDEKGFKVKIEEAKTLASPLSDAVEMKEAFRAIAVAQVNSGDLAAAKSTADLFRGHRFDSPILFIIEALAKKGEFDAAHHLRGSSGFTKHTGSLTGAMIAEAEAAAGKFQNARNTAKGISYEGPRLATFAKISVLEQDLATARAAAGALLQSEEMNEARQANGGRILALTGPLQARTEGFAAALDWARGLSHPTVRTLALLALAESIANNPQ